MKIKKSESTCIGCGCTDNNACIDTVDGYPCSWLVVDRMTGKGVCSECPGHLREFRKLMREKSE